MARIVRKEVRKRGFFGWIFFVLFWGFNAFMAYGLFLGLNAVSSMPTGDGAEAAGRAIGATVGTGILLVFWVLGAIILGLLALFSRGQKTIVEEINQD